MKGFSYYYISQRMIIASIFLLCLILGPAWTECATDINSDIIVDTTLGLTAPDPGGIYVITADISVRNGAILTIESGVQVLFDFGTSLSIGSESLTEAGTLIAIGTKALRIIFTAIDADPHPGFFDGIFFTPWTGIDTELVFCEVSYGGASPYANIGIRGCGFPMTSCTSRFSATDGMMCSNGADPSLFSCRFTDNRGDGVSLQDTGSVVINNCTVQYNDNGISMTNSNPEISYSMIYANRGNGIQVYDAASQPRIHHTSMNSNENYPLYVFAGDLSAVTDNTYTGNTYQMITVVGEVLGSDAQWQNPGIPYRITSNVSIQGQDGPDMVTTLTIEAGTTLRFTSTTGLTIGHASNAGLPGALSAVGTAGENIVFTADSASPVAGYWNGLTFNRYADGGLCQLVHTTVFYGGYSGFENISIDSCSPSFAFVESAFGAGAGIACFNGAAPTLTSCTVHDNTARGIHCDASSPSITSCTVSGNASYGIYLTNGASPVISGCGISANAGYGLYVASANSVVSVNDCSFTNNPGYPVYLYVGQVPGLGTGNNYIGNTYQQIYVTSGAISMDATWRNQGIPYKITADLLIQGQDGPDLVTTLTLESGVTLQFGNQLGLTVGHQTNSSLPGAVHAVGTALNRVTFTADSSSPSAGYWDGIWLSDFADDTLTIFEHCLVSYGGYSINENIYFATSSPTLSFVESAFGAGAGIACFNGAAPTLTSCTVHDNTAQGIHCDASSPSIVSCTVSGNASYGIYLTNGASPVIGGCGISANAGYGLYVASANSVVSVNDCSFTNNPGYPVYLYVGQVPGLGTGNNYIGNTYQQIYVTGGAISMDATWRNQGIPYKITADVLVQGQDGPDLVTTLTLEPGVALQFGSQFGLTVGHQTNSSLPGAVHAVGTALNRVTFTADSSSPSAGYWDGIWLSDYANDTLTIFEHCLVSYGGYSINENIYFAASSPTLSFVESAFGAGAGIACFNGAAPTLTSCTINDNTAQGIHCDASSPSIASCTVSGNASYGIYLTNGASPVIGGCGISANTGYGLYVASANSVVSVNDCSFTNNPGYPVYLYVGQVPGLGTGNNYIGNMYQQIYVTGGAISMDATWRNQGIPYKITANLLVQGQDGPDLVTTLTLEPGVALQFGSQLGLTVGHQMNSLYPGKLLVIGSELQAIVFTADTVTPSPGYWKGLYFSRYASNQSEIERARIEFGGYAGTAGITCNFCSPLLKNLSVTHNTTGIQCLNSASPMITLSDIVDNVSFGIYCNDPLTKPVISRTTIRGQTYGIYVNNTAEPVIGGGVDEVNNIFGNSNHGVYNSSSTTCVDATFNWWGDATGPNDVSAAADDCVNAANSGAGDTVSDDVDYQNWVGIPNYTPTPTLTPTPTPTVTPTPTPVPEIVDLMLTAVDGDGDTAVDDVRCDWGSIAGAIGYRIYRGDAPSPQPSLLITETANTFAFDLDALIDGTDHYYEVIPLFEGRQYDTEVPTINGVVLCIIVFMLIPCLFLQEARRRKHS